MEKKLEKIYDRLRTDGFKQEIAWVDGSRHFKGYEKEGSRMVIVSYYVRDGEVMVVSTYREFDYV